MGASWVTNTPAELTLYEGVVGASWGHQQPVGGGSQVRCKGFSGSGEGPHKSWFPRF